MARLAFVAPPFLGHLNPMRALALELVARGHEAVFVGMPDMAALVDGRGLAFRAVGHCSHPPGTLASVTARMAAIDGFAGLPGILRDVAAATDMLARELPEALRGLRADLLVCDGTEAAGGLAADSLDLPYVTVANALPLNREPAMPPPFTGWRYDPSRWGIERNMGGYRVADWLMRRHGDVIAGHARRLRLPPRRSLDACLSPLAQIGQTVAALDFPRQALPAVFHHCGPLRIPDEPLGDEEPEDDGRPLLFATLGSLQGGRVRLVRTIAEAARRAGFRLLLAHGGRLPKAEAARLPGRPTVRSFVSQPAVLARSSVAVVNGGLNTVMDALAEAVPLVVLPIAFEQAAVAARVERTGAGRALSRRFLSAGRLAASLRDVSISPDAKVAASRLATAIAIAGGVGRAADVVERVLATGRPVPRAGAELNGSGARSVA